MEDDVSSNFGKMSLISATTTLHLPVLVYEYKDKDGYSYVTADVLMLSGSTVKETVVELGEDAQTVTVLVMLPETFLQPDRIDVEDQKRGLKSPATKAAALRAAVDNLRSTADRKDGRVAFPFVFKLPVACRPYFLNEPFIGTYPNDWENHRKHHNNYKILHIDFQSAYEPKSYSTKLKESKKPMKSHLPETLDSDSDDDSSDASMGQGGRPGAVHSNP